MAPIGPAKENYGSTQEMRECSLHLSSPRKREILQRPLRGHREQNGDQLPVSPRGLWRQTCLSWVPVAASAGGERGAGDAKFSRCGFPPAWVESPIEGSLRLPDPDAWPRRLPDLQIPGPKDAPRLALAHAAGAWLVTGNLKHFPENARFGVIVVAPAEYRVGSGMETGSLKGRENGRSGGKGCNHNACFRSTGFAGETGRRAGAGRWRFSGYLDDLRAGAEDPSCGNRSGVLPAQVGGRGQGAEFLSRPHSR